MDTKIFGSKLEVKVGSPRLRGLSTVEKKFETIESQKMKREGNEQNKMCITR